MNNNDDPTIEMLLGLHAVNFVIDKDLGLSIRDIDESLERIRIVNEEAKVPTGYTNLDNIMDGGLHPKELVVFSEIPGSYKTGILGNIALNCFFKPSLPSDK